MSRKTSQKKLRQLPPTDPSARLGKLMYAIRQKRGKGGLEMACALGTNPSTLSRWERGGREIPLSKMRRICEVYGLTKFDLLDGAFDISEHQKVCAQTT